MSEIKERLSRRKQPVEKQLKESGKVWIRRLTCEEVLGFIEEDDNAAGLRKLVADALVDAEGKNVFTAEEVAALDWAIVKEISDAALDVNKLKVTNAKKKSTTPPSAG